MAELADAQDLKSCGTNLPCRFDSGLRHCGFDKRALVAQLVEQRTENPRVTGSIPVLGINPYKYYLAVFVGVFYVQLLPVTAHNSLSAEINCRAETENTHDAKGVEDGTFLKYN